MEAAAAHEGQVPADLVEAGRAIVYADTEAAVEAIEQAVMARHAGQRGGLADAVETRNGSNSPFDVLRALADERRAQLALRRRLEAIEVERAQVDADYLSAEAFHVASQALSRTGSFRWDLTGGGDEWSREGLELFEVDPKTFVPSFESFLARIHPDDAAIHRYRAPAQVAAGEIVDLHYRVVLSDGSVRHLHTLARPGRPGEYLGAIIDETERREMRDAIRRAHTELARVSRLLTMGELAASLTHELNQPLTSIVANAAASIRWLRQEPPNLERASASLEAIIEERGRAGDVIGNLRAMARKSEPELAPIPIDDIIGDVVQLLSGELDLKGVALTARPAPDRPIVLGDRIQLQQVFLNLVLNGMDAVLEGASPARAVVLSTTQASDGRVLVGVADTGRGVPAEIADRMFEPLFSTKPDRLGMGLTLARTILDAHKGELRLGPPQTRGALFQVLLPVPEADA